MGVVGTGCELLALESKVWPIATRDSDSLRELWLLRVKLVSSYTRLIRYTRLKAALFLLEGESPNFGNQNCCIEMWRGSSKRATMEASTPVTARTRCEFEVENRNFQCARTTPHHHSARLSAMSRRARRGAH